MTRASPDTSGDMGTPVRVRDDCQIAGIPGMGVSSFAGKTGEAIKQRMVDPNFEVKVRFEGEGGTYGFRWDELEVLPEIRTGVIIDNFEIPEVS